MGSRWVINWRWQSCKWINEQAVAHQEGHGSKRVHFSFLETRSRRIWQSAKRREKTYPKLKYTRTQVCAANKRANSPCTHATEAGGSHKQPMIRAGQVHALVRWR